MEQNTVSVKPPNYLIINNELDMSEEWKRWVQLFNWYSTAIYLQTRPREVQVAIFMSAIGPDAATIYNTFGLTAAEEVDLKVIMKKFEEHFVPQKNITFERYLFNKIKQRVGEPFNNFLTRVINKSKTCEFGPIKDSIIKDKLVDGIANEELKEKLLFEENLTLVRAINLCKEFEQIKHQGQSMKTKRAQKLNSQISQVFKTKKAFNCQRCGTVNKRKANSGLNKGCTRCSKVNNFRVVCESPNPVDQQIYRHSDGQEDKVLVVNKVGTDMKKLKINRRMIFREYLNMKKRLMNLFAKKKRERDMENMDYPKIYKPDKEWYCYPDKMCYF